MKITLVSIVWILSLPLLASSNTHCLNSVAQWAPNYSYAARMNVAEIACKKNIPLEPLMLCLNTVYSWASNYAAGSRAKAAAIACSEGAPLRKLMMCMAKAAESSQAWARSEIGETVAAQCKDIK